MGVFGIKGKPTSKDATKDGGRENDTDEIRDTDIVFECPHCGKCLMIDYRGAGLQIHCSECHEPVLVPIPDGMELDDLDRDPTELLNRFFAARRSYQKAEQKIELLKARLLQIQETVGVMKAVVSEGVARSNDECVRVNTPKRKGAKKDVLSPLSIGVVEKCLQPICEEEVAEADGSLLHFSSDTDREDRKLDYRALAAADDPFKGLSKHEAKKMVVYFNRFFNPPMNDTAIYKRYGFVPCAMDLGEYTFLMLEVVEELCGLPSGGGSGRI